MDVDERRVRVCGCGCILLEMGWGVCEWGAGEAYGGMGGDGGAGGMILVMVSRL